MARLGWMSDTHVNTDNERAPGAGTRLTADVVSLFEDYGVEHLYINGDAVAPNNGWQRDVHTKPAYYDEFWRLIDESGYGDCAICTPGNHECPLQLFVASDSRARLRYRTEFDGVTLLMVNTAAPAWVTGGRGAAYGWNNGHVPKTDLAWLDTQLDEAGEDAKLVFFHHHAWLTPGDPFASAPAGTRTMHQGNLYEVCRNYQEIHRLLSSYEKVVVPQGHTYQFTAEGASNVDGVEYLYKKHYYETVSDTVYSYAFIDIDEAGCTVTTVDHRAGSESVILDKTFT